MGTRPRDGTRRSRHGAGAALAAAALLALSGCATVDRDDLASYVDQLHSDAAEGALLAGQAAARRLPTIFVWLHSAELTHHVKEVGDHLTGETAQAGDGRDVTGAARFATAVGDALGALHHAPADPAQAGRVQAGLDHQAREIESLYERLQ